MSESLQFEKLTFAATFSSSEGVERKITYRSTDVKYVIVTIYRRPNSNVTEFNENLNIRFLVI